MAKSRTQLSDFTFTIPFHELEKEMATHSSVLAWRIPGTGKPGGLPSMGSHRVGHDWSDLAAAAAAAYTKKCTHVYTHINTRGALERCSLLEELGAMNNKVSWIIHCVISVSSVQFSHSVVSDSLRPHESQHARPPCASPSPGVHSNSRPSSR